MGTTVVKPCRCRSKFQDERYGEGKRLMNVSQKKNEHFARCTVCAATHSTVRETKPAPKKE